VCTVAVIMAGGRGERFRPRSTASVLKQSLHLWGEGTILQQIFERALKVTNSELVLSQFPAPRPENLIVERGSRDTPPAAGCGHVYMG